MWKTSTISCLNLIAQLISESEFPTSGVGKSMIIFFGRLLLLQTSPVILNQMHVVVLSESTFNVSACCL